MTDASSTSSAQAMAKDSRPDTELKVVKSKLECVWTIKNFSGCAMETGQFLKSPTFSPEPNDQQQPKWYLHLYPKGHKEELKDYVTLFLYRAKYPTAVNARFKFAILDVYGEQTTVKASIEKFLPHGDNWFRIRRDILMGREKELLPNDQLSIHCEVETFTTSESQVHKFRLSDDMGALLENGLFTDCMLCSSDGKEFQAYKGVLACRSPVFAAMFTNDTEEKQTGRVNIPDISAPVLSQLLHFVYTGCEPKLLAEQDMAQGLLAAADKYQLDRLKALCELQIFRGLNKENVCTVLALADRHNAEHLKTSAIEYICSHAQEVLETDGWQTLFSSRSELLKQVIKALAANQQKSS